MRKTVHSGRWSGPSREATNIYGSAMCCGSWKGEQKRVEKPVLVGKVVLPSAAFLTTSNHTSEYGYRNYAHVIT